MGKKHSEAGSVGAFHIPAAPHKAELSVEMGIQPLPQGYHKLTERQSGVAAPHFLPPQATQSTNLSHLLGARVPHSLSPMAHNSPGTLDQLWLTEVQAASFRMFACLRTLSGLPCPALRFSDMGTALYTTAERCKAFGGKSLTTRTE